MPLPARFTNLFGCTCAFPACPYAETDYSAELDEQLCRPPILPNRAHRHAHLLYCSAPLQLTSGVVERHRLKTHIIQRVSGWHTWGKVPAHTCRTRNGYAGADMKNVPVRLHLISIMMAIVAQLTLDTQLVPVCHSEALKSSEFGPPGAE
ncbi:hypothetical protein B0H17DRAFT_1130299 [Mycena rosella]|uniref:Uncharacterized protein n=1 Tax=Mycena rosella TaxID=1033263 RepID=A0AAD7GPF5_MYCRO|nr:hypothetical protein B0H17DRAFT_1130299 [Mycena rosella]